MPVLKHTADLNSNVVMVTRLFIVMVTVTFSIVELFLSSLPNRLFFIVGQT